MVGCLGGNTTLYGGRRRRSGKVKKTKKMRGGNFYGFKGAVGTNGADWGAVENLAAKPDGTILPNNASELLAAPIVGGRRRRGRGKKTRKGGRKSRRRTMRGGASWYSPRVAGGSFIGDGQSGLPNLTSYSVNTAPGGPVEGFDGAMHP